MKKRTYGTGSISFDKSTNKIVARIRINGSIKKKTFPKGKQSAAESWLKSMQHQPMGKMLSVGEFLLYYIKNFKEPFLRKRSLERLKQAAYHLENLYNIPLAMLQPSDIQEMINSMQASGLSASTIKKSHDLLKAIYKQAIAEGIVSTNPAIATKRPPMPSKDKIEIFTKKEIGKIFRAIRKLQNSKRNTSQRYDMILFFRMLLTTGMRVAELLALKWENIDDDCIHVKGSKDIDSQTINEPKTIAGIRSIPYLSPKTKAMLFSYRKKKGFIFENKNGGAMNYQRVFLTWRRIRSMSGITKKIHCFRHTCISYLLTYGNIPIATVSAIAGHSNSAITLQVYTHIVNEYKMKFGTHSGHNSMKQSKI